MTKRPRVIADIYPLVVIIWTDHTVCSDTWIEADEVDELATIDRISTVGWLIKTTPDSYIVANTLSEDTTVLGSVRTIGKGMVEKVKVIKGRMKK